MLSRWFCMMNSVFGISSVLTTIPTPLAEINMQPLTEPPPWFTDGCRHCCTSLLTYSVHTDEGLNPPKNAIDPTWWVLWHAASNKVLIQIQFKTGSLLIVYVLNQVSLFYTWMPLKMVRSKDWTENGWKRSQMEKLWMTLTKPEELLFKKTLKHMGMSGYLKQNIKE